MTIKQKILDALDATLDDLDEERLLQILLDAYACKKLRIASLEHQQIDMKVAAQRDTEALMEERRRLHTYAAMGEYFFTRADAYGLAEKLVVRIAGRQVEMYERKPGYDVAIMQVSREEFFK